MGIFINMNTKIISLRQDKPVNDNNLNICVVLNNKALIYNFSSFEEKLHQQFPSANIFYMNTSANKDDREYQENEYVYARPSRELDPRIQNKVYIAFGENPQLNVKKHKNGTIDIHYPIAAFKADQPLRLSNSEIVTLKKRYGIIDTKKTIVFGSFGVGSQKENQAFQSIIKSLTKRDDVQILIVPRVITDDRLFEEFKADIGRPVSVISDEEALNEENSPSQITWVKQMGVLKQLYFLSQYSFLGGTFDAQSIQNPMEPARAGSILFIGFNPENYYGNNSQIIKELGSSKGIISVSDGTSVDALTKDIYAMMDNPSKTEIISNDLVRTADQFSKNMNDMIDQLSLALSDVFDPE